jgi:hypothetical protein
MEILGAFILMMASMWGWEEITNRPFKLGFFLSSILAVVGIILVLNFDTV